MESQVVLIVENGMMNRKMISDSLNKEGYRVCFATDAQSALTIFNHTQPLFVFVSLILLKLDTCTFSRIIKNDDDTKDITVVALSDEKQSISRMFYCGFDGIINVSESNRKLAQMIKKYLKKK